MSEKVSLCFQCDGQLYEGMEHSCVKGLTDNIYRLQSTMNTMIKTMLEVKSELRKMRLSE